MSDDRARIREVFGEAIELAPGERPGFLDLACAGDLALREQVESLLAALEHAGEYLGSPSVGAPTNGAPTAPREQAGALIGRYKLLEQIGEGGFGVVFLAEQREPVVRKVALKIIKLGMDTRQVIARFEAERQALAMMDHPNIARVLDAGATDTGRPYFVMELVRGDLITAYCDRNRLTTKDRLDLFTQVCQAVQHAHQKGVIHRDIKPSNVLITVADGKPIPKVIDFGIAKATSARLTEKTLFTEHRALIGTPAYMSPEQAEMSGVDIDTRSDIYSLGVLLYELLTGTTPFDTRSLMAAGLAEIQRIIREVEPEKPSTRLSTLQAALPPGAVTRRDTEPGPRPASLRGDLDWIVMKALEKDRTRRYETASALALEVERYLKNEPVLAGPPSRVYRFRKFARRNRTMVAAAGAVAGVLLAGMAGTTFGLVREREQRELAEKREKETRQVSDFQATMLNGIDVVAMGRGIKDRFREQVRAGLERQYVGDSPNRRARTQEEIEAELAAFDVRANAAQAADVALGVMDEFVLARAAESLEKQFADQPRVRADLHNAIGATYHKLGLYSAAEPHLAKALAIHRRERGDDHADTLTAIDNMGGVLQRQGRFADAEPYFLEAMERCRRVHGNDHPDTLAAFNAMGYLFHKLGKLSEAEQYYSVALAGRRRVRGNEHSETLTSINNMGALLQDQGKLAEAEAHLREALEGDRRFLADDDPDRLTSLNNLGVLLKVMDRFAEAEEYSREAMDGRRRVLGNEHPETLISINNMGDLLDHQRKRNEAEPLYREAMETSRRVLGDEHPDTLISINNVAYLLRDQDKLAEARSLFAEATQIAQTRLDDHPVTALLEHHHADVLLRMRRLEEAIALARAAVDRYRAHPDWSAREAAHALWVLAAALCRAGRQAEGLAVTWEWIQVMRYLPGKAPIDLASNLAKFAADATAAGDPALLERAEQALRDCLKIRETELPDDHPKVWLRYDAMSMLGEVLVARAADPGLEAAARMARLREAEPLVLNAWEKLEDDPRVPPASETDGSCRKRAALARIVRLYDAWHAAEPSKVHDGEAARWRAELEKLSTSSSVPADSTRGR